MIDGSGQMLFILVVIFMRRNVRLCSVAGVQLDDWVLCRIYKKSTSAQRTGKERESSSCVEEVYIYMFIHSP